jgi:hypothetical protein
LRRLTAPPQTQSYFFARLRRAMFRKARRSRAVICFFFFSRRKPQKKAHGNGGIGRDPPLLCFATGVIHENLI